ncbi:MFS alpha-glucoside transporter [Mizugakiibacter sediminis]|uniref:MFS alpha-glucoside transporter n=1 Tax=Mizugakiibacter sediminis TaxID=1475481 RepID=A0A0K8QRD6_9GAMM|nr:hypothetical protein [Mizugakiibacter sediminis]GAP67211.1 MFS alpha-glucoside transporter [Mizugakiibacter sediminis]
MLLDLAAALVVSLLGLLALAKFDAWCEQRHGRRHFSMPLFAPILGAAVLLVFGADLLADGDAPAWLAFGLLGFGALAASVVATARLLRPHGAAGIAGTLLEAGVFAALAGLSLPLLAIAAVVYVGAMFGLGGTALQR